MGEFLLPNGLIPCEILKQELGLNLGSIELAKVIWETTVLLEKVSLNLELIMALATECTLDNSDRRLS